MTHSIYRLIANHAHALARLIETPDSTPSGELNPDWELASDAERTALTQLIEGSPRGNVELRRKADYLLMHIRYGETFDHEDTRALLRSMAALSAPLDTD